MTRKPAPPKSVIVGINDDGEPCCAHLFNSSRRDCGSHKTWAAYTLARPDAKSERIPSRVSATTAKRLEAVYAKLHAMEKRTAAKSEIDKAVADATLRANRRAARIVLRYPCIVNPKREPGHFRVVIANEIMGKRREK